MGADTKVLALSLVGAALAGDDNRNSVAAEVIFDLDGDELQRLVIELSRIAAQQAAAMCLGDTDRAARFVDGLRQDVMNGNDR